MVHGEHQNQGRSEEQEPGRHVQETLRHGVTEEVGQQHEGRDAYDVGDDRDRND